MKNLKKATYRSNSDWQKLLEQWRISGETPRSWCKKHQIAYTSFMERKKRHKDVISSERMSICKESFIELPLTSKKAEELILSCNGVQIHLQEGFDPLLLLQCIKTLKENV